MSPQIEFVASSSPRSAPAASSLANELEASGIAVPSSPGQKPGEPSGGEPGPGSAPEAVAALARIVLTPAGVAVPEPGLVDDGLGSFAQPTGKIDSDTIAARNVLTELPRLTSAPQVVRMRAAGVAPPTWGGTCPVAPTAGRGLMAMPNTAHGSRFFLGARLGRRGFTGIAVRAVSSFG